MYEVHRPDLVRCCRRRSAIAQLRLDPALGRFVAQLQALLAIEPTYPFDIDLPSFTPEKHVNPPIAVAHARLGNLFDPLAQGRLPGTLGAVVIGGAVDRK